MGNCFICGDWAQFSPVVMRLSYIISALMEFFTCSKGTDLLHDDCALFYLDDVTHDWPAVMMHTFLSTITLHCLYL